MTNGGSKPDSHIMPVTLCLNVNMSSRMGDIHLDILLHIITTGPQYTNPMIYINMFSLDYPFTKIYFHLVQV